MRRRNVPKLAGSVGTVVMLLAAYLPSTIAFNSRYKKLEGQKLRRTLPSGDNDGFDFRSYQRKSFSRSRAMLISAGVPFEPNELLEKDWREVLGPRLDAMPEMAASRTAGPLLSGAYLADTLVL